LSASLNDRPNKVTVVDESVTVTAGAGVQGAQGDPGIVISGTEPDETDVLWADTSAAGSMVVPAGGSSGQVLAKASGDDYDSEWVTPASSGIPATLLDAKGDLIVASAADTAARLGIGADGQILQADSTTGTGIAWKKKAVDGAAAVAAGNNYWGIPGCGTIAANSSVSMSGLGNFVVYTPMLVSDSITITDAQISVVTLAASTGGLARLSCYTADGTWQPVALVADWGEVATTTTGDKTISSLSTVLTTGRYLLRVHFNSTATMPTMLFLTSFVPGGINTTISGVSTVTYWRRSVTYAPAEANPSPWNASSTVNGANNQTTGAQRALIQVRWT